MINIITFWFHDHVYGVSEEITQTPNGGDQADKLNVVVCPTEDLEAEKSKLTIEVESHGPGWILDLLPDKSTNKLPFKSPHKFAVGRRNG